MRKEFYKTEEEDESRVVSGEEDHGETKSGTSRVTTSRYNSLYEWIQVKWLSQ